MTGELLKPLKQLPIQFSHAFYLIAAIKAWNKGYTIYSSFLFSLVVVSSIHHVFEDTSRIFDFFEGNLLIAFAIYSFIEFRKTIKYTHIILFCVFLLLNRLAYVNKQKRKLNYYALYHSIWHLGSGLVLINIVDKAPKKFLV
jgi:hypothetical protein